MFETRYTYVHEGRKYKGRDGWSPGPVTRDGLNRIRDAGLRYELFVNGDRLAKRQNVADIQPLLRAALERERFGTDVRVKGTLEGAVIDGVKFVKVRKKLILPDDPEFVYGAGPVIDDVAKWGGFLREKYEGNGSFRFAGMTVCKPDSDHAHGAACDNFDTWSNMHEQVRDAFRGHYDGRWTVKYVILADDLFKPDGRGGFYRAGSGSSYHAHVHVSFVGGLTWGCRYERDTPWS